MLYARLRVRARGSSVRPSEDELAGTLHTCTYARAAKTTVGAVRPLDLTTIANIVTLRFNPRRRRSHPYK